MRLSNDMEDYALEYLADHQILNESEDLIAYYDATLTLNGSEAIILTSERVIYHKDGRSDSINLADIEDIQHSEDTFPGRCVHRHFRFGQVNGGDRFNSVLMDAWERARER